MGKDSCNDFGVKIKVKFGLMSGAILQPNTSEGFV